jgi:hypothetical protein
MVRFLLDLIREVREAWRLMPVWAAAAHGVTRPTECECGWFLDADRHCPACNNELAA